MKFPEDLPYTLEDADEYELAYIESIVRDCAKVCREHEFTQKAATAILARYGLKE